MRTADRKLREVEPTLNEWTRLVVDAALQVHRVLGPGFLERHYEAALVRELSLRSVPFAQQVDVEVFYRSDSIGVVRLDLVIADRVVVELKAVETLFAVHHAQLLSYLKASGYELGLLINFNVPLLKQGIRRIVSTQHPEH
jgi:GxxExxY protein